MHAQKYTHKAIPQPENSPSLVSERGKPLMNLHPPKPSGVAITLELYAKWYHVYMVTAMGEVFIVDPELLSDISCDSPKCLWVDHTFHPELLLRVAKHLGEAAFVDDIVLDAAGGRWIMEGRKEVPEFSYILEEDED